MVARAFYSEPAGIAILPFRPRHSTKADDAVSPARVSEPEKRLGPVRPAARRLRRILPLSTVYLTLMAILPVPRVADAGQAIRVGVYDNPPKIGRSDSGVPEGIFVDILEDIAAREGWKLEYVFGTWKECLDRLAAGEIDIMPDVAFTPERGEKYAFGSEPVLSSWFQITRGAGAVFGH